MAVTLPLWTLYYKIAYEEWSQENHELYGESVDEFIIAPVCILSACMLYLVQQIYIYI